MEKEEQQVDNSAIAKPTISQSIPQEKDNEEENTSEPVKAEQKSKESDKLVQKKEDSQPLSKAKQVPFPQRLQKQHQEQNFKRFLDILEQLQINIPFMEALHNMPSYVKFMRDILTKKKRLEEYETVALTKECSSYVSNKLPQKLEDPGSFTIPCTIGDRYIGRALCDLGSSINLMPTSILKTLGVKASPTTVTLQLADRTLAYPDGKIENILVKVDRFIFFSRFYNLRL
ncbi:uncharacterized protein LOC133310404 [Gastrolobium bilobum]|uniref:uncharacterized protein LOC133310404 n=1 Tax=Gastrolobium bilobum TaxID=150636 RepID=UPI002AB250A9|nr:uncharacterized protein LOC133310404 [Gastrolobium bilobum]